MATQEMPTKQRRIRARKAVVIQPAARQPQATAVQRHRER